MSDENSVAEADAAPKKKSKAMLFGLLGAVFLGGGAFYGVYSGLIPLPFGKDPPAQADAGAPGAEMAEDRPPDEMEPVAFVPLDEMIISLGPEATARHLKVRVSIEVDPESTDAVAALTPRILDVLNTFLRAVDERDFEVPRAMMRIRAQMLRRVQLVTPQGAVRNVLIQEFVLN